MNRMSDDALVAEWRDATEREAAQYAADVAADAAHYAAYMAEAERAQAAHIAAEDARVAGALVQVGPYTYADPQCRQCRGTGVVTDSVDYGSTTANLESPCDCAVDYLWAVTDGDGITITHGQVTATAIVRNGVPVLDVVTVLGGSVGVTEFPTAAALLDACATIAPLSAWAVVWDDMGADDAPRY